ncbi:MAG: hypothetical protein ABIP29_01630 [Candidatus Eisenbacteria bacterium]
MDGHEGSFGVIEAGQQRARARQAEARLAALETVEPLESRPVGVVRDQGR